MDMNSTHALYLVTVSGEFAIADGSLSVMKKERTKWKTKISKARKESKWISPPDTLLPVDFMPEGILGIRIVEIPVEYRVAMQKAQDPRNRTFVDQANAMGKTVEENPGVDLLDMGFKR